MSNDDIRLDQTAVQRSFHRAATHYDEHAVLQQTVEDRLLERLAFVRQPPSRVLDLGCGTGRGSVALLKSNEKAKVFSLDVAPGMLQQLKARKGWFQRNFPKPVCASMQDLPLADGSIDLIFSNLAIQWSSDLSQLFDECRRVLRPDGLLLFTTFGPETLGELRQAWAEVDGRSHVSGFFEIHDIGDALVQAGFDQPVMDRELFTLDYAQPIEVFRDLKAIGATNAVSNRRRGLTGKNRLRSVLDAYEQFRRDGRVPATYEVIFGTAFGPAEGQPRKTPGGDVATFSVESVRKRKS